MALQGKKGEMKSVNFLLRLDNRACSMVKYTGIQYRDERKEYRASHHKRVRVGG